MNASAFSAIAVTGFTVAFLHAAIPTHWLPFVLTGRVQKWNRSKTLLITALAGCGHVLFTGVLGFVVAWSGMTLSSKLGGIFPLLAGGALVLFGLFYVVQQLRGKSHGHAHLFGGHDHGGHDHATHDQGHEHAGHDHGPHGGMLVDTGHGFVELTVFETGVPPRWRLFFQDETMRAVEAPAAESVTIETVRYGRQRDTFTFRRVDGLFESTTDIPEPHEFHAIVRVMHDGHTHAHAVRFVEGHDHGHGHPHVHECDHDEAVAAPPLKSDWAAITSLLTLLTFSPCEGFLPVYVSGVEYGWTGFLLLTAILSMATVAGMIVFTWLTLAGMEKLKLGWLEKYESGVLGALLVVLGLIVVVFEH